MGDHKIENCDHQITSDVDKFSEIFAMVFIFYDVFTITIIIFALIQL